MRKIVLNIIFVLSFFTTIAQVDSSYTFIKILDSTITYFSTDKLLNTYTWKQDGTLSKYNSQGQLRFEYSFQDYGDLTLIDATNPLQVLLYFKDYQTVVTVDRTLSPSSVFTFSDLNLFEIKAVGVSNDGQVWFYDELNFKLKKISRQGVLLAESEDLSLSFDFILQPNFLLVKGEWVYLNDPTQGILVFDAFGRFSRQLNIKDLTTFQVIENQLFYYKNNQLSAFNLLSLKTQNIPLPKSTITGVRVDKNRLFLLKDEDLLLYLF